MEKGLTQGNLQISLCSALILLLPLPLPLPLRLSHCYALLSNSAACSGFRELVKIIGLYCAQFALTRPRERESPTSPCLLPASSLANPTLPATLPIVHSCAFVRSSRCLVRCPLSRPSRLSTSLSRRMSNLLGQRQRVEATTRHCGSDSKYPLWPTRPAPSHSLSTFQPFTPLSTYKTYLPQDDRPYPITPRTLSPSSRRARERAEIRVEPEYVEYALCDRRVVALLLFYCHFARTKRRSR